MKDFRNLKVWQKAHDLTLDVYKVSKAFPQDERFGLTSQMRRSSSSIPTNIAEGCGRSGDAEMARFFSYAMGSASELEYQILLAHDLDFINAATSERLNNGVTEVKRMLTAFIQKLTAER